MLCYFGIKWIISSAGVISNGLFLFHRPTATRRISWMILDKSVKVEYLPLCCVYEAPQEASSLFTIDNTPFSSFQRHLPSF